MCPKASQNLIRVVLIDNKLVRTGLRMLIETWPRLQVVGEAGNPGDAVAIVRRERPDIILLELDLGESGGGLDLLPELLSAVGNGHVIVLTRAHEFESNYQAMRLGVMGLVPKNQAAEQLHKAILRVHAGEAWFDPNLMAGILSRMSRAGGSKKGEAEAAKIASLTKREREVMALVGEGLKNKAIAKRLFISEITVRHHLTSIFSKLEVKDRLELIVYLFQHKLIKASQG